MVDRGKLGEIRVAGTRGLELLEGLASRTRLRILELIAKRDMDVSSLARALGLGEPTVSSEVALLERLKLLEVTYVKGRRGIRKVCRLAKKRVLVAFE